jgi:Uma2 family endonuclease
MATTAKVMTAEELLELPDDGQRYELIAGALLAMPPTGEEHGGIGTTVIISLGTYVRANHLGIVLNGETGYLLSSNPDTVRAADVSFVRQERVATEGWLRGYRRGAPDLVVEIISPSDRYADVEEKVVEWFDGGAQMVVVINPRRRSVTIYRSPIEARVLTIGDVLDGQNVVPGWRMPVAEIFER